MTAWAPTWGGAAGSEAVSAHHPTVLKSQPHLTGCVTLSTCLTAQNLRVWPASGNKASPTGLQ